MIVSLEGNKHLAIFHEKKNLEEIFQIGLEFCVCIDDLSFAICLIIDKNVFRGRIKIKQYIVIKAKVNIVL